VAVTYEPYITSSSDSNLSVLRKRLSTEYGVCYKIHLIMIYNFFQTFFRMVNIQRNTGKVLFDCAQFFYFLQCDYPCDNLFMSATHEQV